MTNFNDIFMTLESWGMTDVLLPFMLLFAVIFAILQKVQIFGDKKNINIVVALVISLLVVIPHVTGDYPPGGDVVEIINTAIPNVTVFVVAVVMLMILLGMFGAQINMGASGLKGFIFLAATIIVGVIFADSAGWFGSNRLSARIGFLGDPDTQAAIVVLAVLVIVVLFITGEGGNGSDAVKNVGKGVASVFNEIGKGLNSGSN